MKCPPLKVVTITRKTPIGDPKEGLFTETKEIALVPKAPPPKQKLNHQQRRVLSAQRRKALKKAKMIMKAREQRAKAKLKAVAAEATASSKEVERAQLENGEDQS